MGGSEVLFSRDGLTVAVDGTPGQKQVTIEAPGGQTVTLREDPSSVQVDDGNGNTVRLDASGIVVTSPGAVTLNASIVTISAAAVKVDAATASFSGVVQADTLIANSVVSASYSPGAGNIF